MTDVQIAFLACLAVACVTGRPDWRLPVLFTGNMFASHYLWPAEVTLEALTPVAVLDFAAATGFLLIASRRAAILAGLYGAMPLAYVVVISTGLPTWAIHAMVEILAIVALGVIGGVDRGGGRLVRIARRRFLALGDGGGRDPVRVSRVAGAPISQKGKR